jgi:MFS transporter, DHA2 family, multidrug resistance protein
MAALAVRERSPNSYAVLLVVSLGMLMSVLDSTIVNVAIAKLQVALGASTDAVQWVITAYLLVFAIVLTASGWLADNWGYKRTFLLALALFTLGSFLCSISGSLSMLVISRVVQGMGGGLLGPVGMAIVTRSFPRERLGMVMALFSIPSLACTSFGPTLGGWLIDNFSWHAMFDINVPIGIAGLFLCSFVLRERYGEEKSSFDLPCFLALGVSMSSLLFALSNGNASWNTDGWGSGLMLVCFGLAFAGFCLFALFQATAARPMVDLTLFNNYNFSLSMVVIFVFGLGVFGSDFLLPLYLQTGLGYTPTQAGMIFLPFGFVMIVTGLIGGRLTDRLGPRIPGIAGLALRAYGMYRFTLLTQYSSEADILATVWLLGGGMGLLMSPMQSVAIVSIPPARTAQATSLLQIFRQLGGSFGVAVLSTILVNREKFHVASLGESMSSSSPAFKEAASRILYHALAAGGGTMGEAASRAGRIIMADAQKGAFVAAIDDVYFIAMIVSILSSLPFLFIKAGPRSPASRKGAARPALD